jgi:hypothetical protein
VCERKPGAEATWSATIFCGAKALRLGLLHKAVGGVGADGPGSIRYFDMDGLGVGLRDC